MKTRHLFGKTLLIMLLFLLVSSAAVANAQTDSQEDSQEDEMEDEFDNTTTESSNDDHDEDDDGVSDDDESRNEREVKVYVTQTTAEIESKLESNGTENSFKIEVNTGLNGLEFKLEYETENTTLETEKEFEDDSTEKKKSTNNSIAVNITDLWLFDDKISKSYGTAFEKVLSIQFSSASPTRGPPLDQL